MEYEEKESTMEFGVEEFETEDERDIRRRTNNNTRTPAQLDLPRLPYSTFELDSNLISALASLDKMISDDVWEEEMFSRFEKYYHRTRVA